MLITSGCGSDSEEPEIDEPTDLTSQPSGATGARVDCGIIEIDVSQAYQPTADR